MIKLIHELKQLINLKYKLKELDINLEHQDLQKLINLVAPMLARILGRETPKPYW